MDELRIEIAAGRTSFRPGELIQGHVAWSLESPAQTLELTLLWQTRGKGIVDSGLADNLLIENPPPQGRREFRFIAPDFPYTLSGALLSVVWCLKLLARPGNQQAQSNIVISPTTREIPLAQHA